MGVDKFRKYSENLFEEDLDVSSIIDKEGEFDLVKLVKKSIDPVTGIPRNMKLPEGDFKEAKNYFDYVSNFLGHEAKFPFARQLWLLTMLLGEYCPRCSDKKFLKIENVPVDYDPRHTPDRLQYLNYGRCPKCKATKSELVSAKEMNLYIEMALCIGQRAGKCVTGDTLILTEKGLIAIKNLGADQPYGFSKYKGPKLVLETGEVVSTSHFYKEKAQRLLKVSLRNGMAVTGTANHPIWTYDGWKKLKDLKSQDLVPIKLGQNTWPTEKLVLSKLIEVCDEHFEKTTIASIKVRACYNVELNTKTLNKELAGVLGIYIAEGYSGKPTAFSVTNHDKTIIEYIASNLEKTFKGVSITYKLDKKVILVSNKKIASYFNKLLGGQLDKRSAEKFIPPSILQSPKSVVSEFLKMLFEVDGCLNGRYVNYTSLSSRLIKEIQIVLSNFGIPSKISEGTCFASNGSKTQVRKSCYNLWISGYYALSKFKEEIGFFSDRKKLELDKRIKKLINSRQPNENSKLPTKVKNLWVQCLRDLRTELSLYKKLDSSGRKQSVGIHNIYGDKRVFRKKLGLNRRVVTERVTELREYYKYLSKSLITRFEDLKSLADDFSIQFSEVTKIEKTQPQVTYDFNVPKHHRFIGNGLLNHNSTLTSSVVSYIIHKYLKFPKLSSVCDGIAGSTPLTGTFVGGRTSDAIALLWEPITNIISESPWFCDYHSMLQDWGEHYGLEFYRSKDLYLRYAHRNLEFYPSGPTKRGLRGRTRIITATDEIGWFPTAEESGKDRERADAPEVYDALDRSLLTVRREVRSLLGKGYDNFIPGLAINISSPSSQTDMISRLVNENKDSKRVLAVRLATWEVNPLYQRDNEEIEEAFRKNPVNAERDYGANPPLNASKFIDVAEDQIHRCFTLNNSAAIEQKSKVIKDRLRIAGVLSNVSKPSVLRNSLMAIDAGFTNNAFSVVIITAEEQPLAGGTKTVILKTPVMLEIVPKDGGYLHFSKIYDEILYKLIEIFNVKYLFADRWNSIALLDRAEEDFQKIDFKSTSYSVKYDDFIITKSYLQEQKLLLPKLEMSQEEILRVDNYPYGFLGKPAAHLMYQLMTVKDRGKTVIKGTNATDDIFRALVLGVSRALNDKILPELLKSVVPVDSRRRVGAVVTTRLGGSSYISSSPKSTYLSSNSAPETNSTTSKNVVLVSRR